MAEEKTRYVKFLMGTAHADYGKIAKDRVVQMPVEQADRYIDAGVAEVSTKAAMEKWHKDRAKESEEFRSRAFDFQALNKRAGHDAPERGTVTDVRGRVIVHGGVPDAPEHVQPSTSEPLTDVRGREIGPDADLARIEEARKRVGNPPPPKQEGAKGATAGHQEGVQGTLTGVKPLTDKRPTPEQVGNSPTKDDEKAASRKK